MLSILLSVFAFFASIYFVRRYLESMGVPKGTTRGVLVFAIALTIAYVVAYAVDRLAP